METFTLYSGDEVKSIDEEEDESEKLDTEIRPEKKRERKVATKAELEKIGKKLFKPDASYMELSFVLTHDLIAPEALQIKNLINHLDLSKLNAEMLKHDLEVGRKGYDWRSVLQVMIYSYTKKDNLRNIEQLLKTDPSYRYLMNHSPETLTISIGTLSKIMHLIDPFVMDIYEQACGFLIDRNIADVSTVYHDGTYAKAKNASGDFYSITVSKRVIAETKAKLDIDLLKPELSLSKLAEYNARINEHEAIIVALKGLKRTSMGKHDTDSTILVSKKGVAIMGYTILIFTSKNGYPLLFNVNNSAHDSICSYPLLAKTFELTKRCDKHIDFVLADKAFCFPRFIEKCWEEGAFPIIPPAGFKFIGKEGEYTYSKMNKHFIAHFDLDPDLEFAICKETGAKIRAYDTVLESRIDGYKTRSKVFRLSTPECPGCQYYNKCHNGKDGRAKRISIGVVQNLHIQKIVELEKAGNQFSKIFAKRSSGAESPNAYIANMIALTNLRVVGLERVNRYIAFLLLGDIIARLINTVEFRQIDEKGEKSIWRAKKTAKRPRHSHSKKKG